MTLTNSIATGGVDQIAYWPTAALGAQPTAAQLAAVTAAQVTAAQAAVVQGAASALLALTGDPQALKDRAVLYALASAINALMAAVSGIQTAITANATLAAVQTAAGGVAVPTQLTPATVKASVRAVIAAGSASS